MSRLAIKVTWLDGTEEYLKAGYKAALFVNAVQAEQMKSFMLEGISDEVQSINVVPYPSEASENSDNLLDLDRNDWGGDLS